MIRVVKDAFYVHFQQFINPILHAAWLDIHALTLKINYVLVKSLAYLPKLLL